MLWTYRVFCDNQGRYSIREVFYEQDGQIIDCGKIPVAVVESSLEELIQLIQWFKDAFELPVLSLEETEAKIAALSDRNPSPERIPLARAIAELGLKQD
ncbi:MAG: hypothetical protein AAGA60_27480 [Cyanobacteria bacterium P01_E01_bin.42]